MTLVLFTSVFFLVGFPLVVLLISLSGHIMEVGGPLFIALCVSAPLPLVLTGFFCTVEGILNAVRSLSGKPVHYPLSIPFIK
jgi:uncharacterized Tic20 family protein